MAKMPIKVLPESAMSCIAFFFSPHWHWLSKRIALFSQNVCNVWHTIWTLSTSIEIIQSYCCFFYVILVLHLLSFGHTVNLLCAGAPHYCSLHQLERTAVGANAFM